MLEGRPGWLIEFREQNSLTFVRTPDGRDQPSRVVALVDIADRRGAPDRPDVGAREGVDHRVLRPRPGIPVPVPIRMAERYVARTGELVAGEATYANFRQFQTSARIVP